MLLFIGGAARTGKSILSRRLLTEIQFPFLSLDVLKMGLTRGAPEFTIDPDAGGIQVAERIWPLVREMSASLLHDGINYIFEGEILPQHVAALRDAAPSQIRACFLGYPTISPDKKLQEIRTHSGHPNDWPQEYNDSDLLTVVQREIIFSQYLQKECLQHRLRFFDTSHQFLPTLDAAAAYAQQSISSTAGLPSWRGAV
ncbi:MAG: hypothetical protein H6667_22965 [Ardenticatenaceae bacterium]|nr:hypothetical protein [Ardenticatenaceae bacterium]